MGKVITWGELVQAYIPTHTLASIFKIFISYFLMPNKGKNKLECGWGKML